MKRKLLTAFVTVWMIIMLAPLGALAAEPGVYDEAQLFTSTETAQLQAAVDDYTSLYGCDAVIVTAADTGGKTAQAFADDFYDENGFGEDGVLFLIDMDNRELYISTSGAMIDILDDQRINDLLDIQYAAASDGNYYDAMMSSFTEMETYTQSGPATGQYRQGNTDGPAENGGRYLSAGWIILSILVGAGVGGLVVLIIYKKYKKEYQAVPYNYRKEAKLALCNTADNLVDTRTTSCYIPPSDSSSSGRSSSTHTSSSGRTHGGGGRGF